MNPTTTQSNRDFLQNLALGITVVVGLFSIYHLYHDIKVTKVKLSQIEAEQKKILQSATFKA